MDDNTIMQAVIAGDIDRLGMLYEKYKNPLFSYFFKLTKGDHAASEDLVQIVFQRVLKYKHRYNGTGLFVSWLFSIGRNCGIDYYRTMHYSDSIDQYPDHFMGDDETDEAILRKEKLNTLYQALDKLKPADKEVLVLSKLDELKQKDIAEILNCTESALRVRIFRALERLREVYVKFELVGK